MYTRLDALEQKFAELQMELRMSRSCTEELRSEVKRLLACTDGVGSQAPSEEALIAKGIRFRDWEDGFNTAIRIIDQRMRCTSFPDNSKKSISVSESSCP